MTDPFAKPGPGQEPPADPPGAGYGQPPPGYGQPAPGYGQPPPGYGQPGAPGEIRSTGTCVLLFFVTLGFYSWYYYFKVHEDMKRHSGTGLGGAIALVLAIFVGIVNPYLMSDEVGKLYSRRGQQPPVTGITGLWYFPGMFIIVGPFIWFAKTNGALNDYWRSQGVQG